MQFRFKKANCVAVGTFNVYIIQPPLLTEMGVLAVGKTVELQADLSQPGVRFTIDNTTWTVRPERLAIETNRFDVNCGAFLAKMLEQLCWTPIKAIGSNAVYVADASAEADLPSGFRLPTAIAEGVSQRTVHIGYKRDRQQINLQLAEADGELELSLNVHTEVRKASSQRRLNESAKQACNSFLDHRTLATDLAADVLKGEFVYEHANAE